MYNYQIDLNDSIKALEKIRDVDMPKIISGKIHSIEGSKNSILVLLDQKSGIDYIREDNNGLQGIAARVQWGYAYNSFTVRRERHTGTKTEYEKRGEQIKNGYFYPAFTMQAYFDNREDNNLLSIAICKTIDLYEFIKKHPQYIKNKESDNKFMVIFWEDFKREKYTLSMIDKTKPKTLFPCYIDRNTSSNELATKQGTKQLVLF